MDQKEIDALISQGSIADFNKKQDELIKSLAEKRDQQQTPAPSSPSPAAGPGPGPDHKKGKVMGQLSRVTEESEAGTNLVMGYLENVLTVISKQQGFIKDVTKKHEENPAAINFSEAMNFVNDNLTVIEELIFSAMDAFQFQDIGRQKLMKVMYTLTKLNEYLNELLAAEEGRDKPFGRQIEAKTLEKDKDKERVDSIVNGYRQDDPADRREPAAESETAAPSVAKSDDDVNDIIAEFQRNQNQTETNEPASSNHEDQAVDDKDIDNIIEEFKKRNQ
jgi:hypothetical protein